jgi:hypothetical protein
MIWVFIWVFIFVCIIIWIALNFFEWFNDKGSFNFLILAFMSLSVLIGLLVGEEIGERSNKPIKPSIEVKCKDGKCDTIYIYKGGRQ